MSDSAKGSISGYIYQFERAFLLLCKITENKGFISIEKVEDVAVHSKEKTILIVEQDKSSIVESTTAFEDTSTDLWRTIELWIQKLKSGLLNNFTIFQCSTNKSIPENSLIKLMSRNNDSFDVIENTIKKLKTSQKIKLNKFKKQDNKKGKHINKILSLIDFALTNSSELKIIVDNLKVFENSNLKTEIISNLHISSYSILQQDIIYSNLLGWIINNCKFKWNNNQHAEITKEDFDFQYKINLTSPSIINAIFRAKKEIDIDKIDFDTKKDEIFVKQIKILRTNNNFQELFIRKAIEDYIRYEIEHSYVINSGNITREDFNDFLIFCKEKWETYFNSLIYKEIEEYSDEEMNELGIRIFTHIINDLQIHFRNDIVFNTENMYIKNGCFLKLSNIPEIGWHPNWKNLIIDNNE